MTISPELAEYLSKKYVWAARLDAAREAVRILNQALALDPDAINALFAVRVPVNQALADHETIQVLQDEPGVTLGALGLINGLFGVDPEQWGLIASEVDSGGRILRFLVRPDNPRNQP